MALGRLTGAGSRVKEHSTSRQCSDTDCRKVAFGGPLRLQQVSAAVLASALNLADVPTPSANPNPTHTTPTCHTQPTHPLTPLENQDRGICACFFFFFSYALCDLTSSSTAIFTGSYGKSPNLVPIDQRAARTCVPRDRMMKMSRLLEGLAGRRVAAIIRTRSKVIRGSLNAVRCFDKR